MSDQEERTQREQPNADGDATATPGDPALLSEDAAQGAVDQCSESPPQGQRVTRRTVHRTSSTEDVAETITEDVPLVWAPPRSDYPSPVG